MKTVRNSKEQLLDKIVVVTKDEGKVGEKTLWS